MPEPEALYLSRFPGGLERVRAHRRLIRRQRLLWTLYFVFGLTPAYVIRGGAQRRAALDSRAWIQVAWLQDGTALVSPPLARPGADAKLVIARPSDEEPLPDIEVPLTRGGVTRRASDLRLLAAALEGSPSETDREAAARIRELWP